MKPSLWRRFTAQLNLLNAGMLMALGFANIFNPFDPHHILYTLLFSLGFWMFVLVGLVRIGRWAGRRTRPIPPPVDPGQEVA
jgi:hypothetical protein